MDYCFQVRHGVDVQSCTIPLFFHPVLSGFFEKKCEYDVAHCSKLIFIIVLLHRAGIILIDSSYLMIQPMPFRKFWQLSNNHYNPCC
jgi:hypothetical protein